MNRLRVLRIEREDYGAALERQDRLLSDRQAGAIPDTLLLTEHPPTITFGSRIRPEHLLVAPAELERRGACLYETRRGGDITFHGPGQIVAYPILDLNDHGRDIHRYVRRLEETILKALGDFGIRGERSPGQTGVWVGDEKIAAIGVEVRRWVTRHGLALNVAPDLRWFRLIVPCGISDKGVTSIKRLLGKAPRRRDVEDSLLRWFIDVFGYSGAFEETDREEIRARSSSSRE